MRFFKKLSDSDGAQVTSSPPHIAVRAGEKMPSKNAGVPTPPATLFRGPSVDAATDPQITLPELRELVDDEAVRRWWATGYTVADLEKRGEMTLFRELEIPTFKCGDDEWTVLHMPLIDRDGNPTPKLLMAIEYGASDIFQWALDLDKHKVEFLEKYFDTQNQQSACAYFKAEECRTVFATTIHNVLEKQSAQNEIGLRGFVVPCDLTIEFDKSNSADIAFSSIFFDRCFFYNDLSFINSNFEFLQFFESSFAETVEIRQCNIQFFGLFDTAIHHIFYTNLRTNDRNYGLFLNIVDSAILQYSSFNAGVWNTRIRNCTNFGSFYANNIDTKKYRLSIKRTSFTGRVSVTLKPSEEAESFKLSSEDSTYSGAIAINTADTACQINLINCEVRGPVLPFDLTLHPNSTFTGTRFSVNPRDFVECARSHECERHEFWQMAPWTEKEDFEYDYDREHAKCIEDMENGFRYLRKLSKENKMTDAELAFYAKQFEVRRMLPGIGLFEKGVMRLYQMTSNYGTSITRPLFVLLLFFIFCSVLVFLGSGQEQSIEETLEWTAFQFLPNIPRTGEAFSVPPELEKLNALLMNSLWGVALTMKIASTLLLALIFIAMRRRFQLD